MCLILAAFENESDIIKESKTTTKAEKTSKAAAVRTVVVRAVKSENEITKVAGNPKRIRNLTFDLDVEGKKYASILFCGKRDALVAVRRFLSEILLFFVAFAESLWCSISFCRFKQLKILIVIITVCNYYNAINNNIIA